MAMPMMQANDVNVSESLASARMGYFDTQVRISPAIPNAIAKALTIMPEKTSGEEESLTPSGMRNIRNGTIAITKAAALNPKPTNCNTLLPLFSPLSAGTVVPSGANLFIFSLYLARTPLSTVVG